MKTVSESVVVALPRERVFELAAERIDRFPLFFRGYGGIIPSVERLENRGPSAVGTLRDVLLGDKTRIVERITAWDPPALHGYEAHEKNPLQKALFTRLESTWRFEPEGSGTRITWSYALEPRSGLLAPVVFLVLAAFRRAMRRCLEAMRKDAESGGPDR